MNSDGQVMGIGSEAPEPPDAVLAFVPGAEPVTPMAVIALEPTAVPKFCRTCGASWQIEWEQCPQCQKHRQRPALHQLDISVEDRALKSTFWLFFTLLGLCVVGLFFTRVASELNIQLAVTAGISVVVFVWCAASFRSVLPALRQSAGIQWFGLAIGLSIATVAIALGTIKGFDRLIQVPDAAMSEPFLKAGFGWAMVVLCVCVQPAIFEELAFRGVIFGGLSKPLSQFETVMVSALMFMILHLAPARFPHTLALGVAAGYLRSRTRSLYPCMVLHFSHNFLCIAMEWVSR